MVQFFEWHDKKVLLTCFRKILHNYNLVKKCFAGCLQKHLKARVWANSDMQYISRLTELCMMQINNILGIIYNKVGAKKSMYFNPMDIGKFFKIIRRFFRHSTTQGRDSPLRLKLEQRIEKLRLEERFLLVPKNILEILDCAASFAKVKCKDYSHNQIMKSYSDIGLNIFIETCANVFALMQSIYAHWSKNPYFKELFYFHNILKCCKRIIIGLKGTPKSFFSK